MQNSVGRFVKRVTAEAERIERLLDQKRRPLTEDEFIRALRSSLRQAAEWGLAKGVNGMRTFDNDKFQQELLVQANSTRGIQDSYRAMNDQFHRMCAVRATEDWADSVERLKTLIYRVATAAGIAIVIFVAGVASYVTGIPLPMLRVG